MAVIDAATGLGVMGSAPTNERLPLPLLPLPLPLLPLWLVGVEGAAAA